MVLVEGLEAELSNRKMHEAVLVSTQAVPLDQQVEQGHSIGKMSLEVAPHPVPHTLEVAHSCQHGEDRLDQHTRVPPVHTTDQQVRRVRTVGLCPLLTSSPAVPLG